ncbi:dihydrofolate reductase family protein [Jiangella rhizosphaerae]|uniref:Dihydrofolate reductase n=1 Tax=Jiangella rhizosphaerae TaxID=2293569 RepID=A0A418KXG9_9ACTN|nr:dihydrofolate reductase family protein [Jiangella rhizosphaerae]RIQ37449.1 dihydrofolate reductase [Jiangella rhizosphaerae]
MRQLVYYIGQSIDGFIAGPNDEVDFYPVPEEYSTWMFTEFGDALPTHARKLARVDDVPNSRFDTIVMGRRTYQPALDVGITSPYAHLRQYVVSSTLTDVHDPAVEVVDGDPLELVRRLKAEDSPLDVYLAGGAALAGAVLPEIDRLVVKQYPVVAGAGVPLFTTGFAPTAFELTDVQSFGSGHVVLDYRRASA